MEKGFVASRRQRALSVAISPVNADPSTDVIYLPFCEPTMLLDFAPADVRADIRLLALDGYWILEWKGKDAVESLQEFRSLEAMFVVLNTHTQDEHTGSQADRLPNWSPVHM
jgi:hypothetical protein